MQATLLAMVVVPLGSIALEADTVYFNCDFELGGCTGESTSATWVFGDFGEYYLSLQFTLVDGADFGVDVNTTVLNDLELDFAARANAFPGYTCLALNAAGDCVDFEVITTAGPAGNWTHYEIEIGWSEYVGLPVYDASRMRILHDFGSDADNLYDEDMCVTALNPDSAYDVCEAIPDPSIRSGNTDFQHFIAAYAPTAVPEPSSLVLLGAGVCGLVLRRRRRE